MFLKPFLPQFEQFRQDLGGNVSLVSFKQAPWLLKTRIILQKWTIIIFTVLLFIFRFHKSYSGDVLPLLLLYTIQKVLTLM